MSGILTKAKNIYMQYRGFHTKRRLLIIESDDWGGIRMPSRQTFEELIKLDDHPENDAFLKNDCLENEQELFDLFDVLESVTDFMGNPAVITANFTMANPNFDRINIQNGYYEYEPFFETYKKYNPNTRVLKTVMEGIEKKCFIPQLHCREHLSVHRWMEDLKLGKKDTIMAFEHKMIGIFKSFSEDNPYGYMDAFNSYYDSNKSFEGILDDSVSIFESVFGYKSKSFVASCHVWDSNLEKILSKKGICGIQTGPWQYESSPYSRTLKRKLHFTGEKSCTGQFYTVRNCSFEPACGHNNINECVENCLAEIRNAFKNNKPAIINSHRLNYIGSINANNARENLQGLKKLLVSVIEEFPNIEFITTPELLDIMMEG